jgi:hypothetical protein
MAKAGFPIVGALFLALAVTNFLQGDGWVVWAILGVLFGGLGASRARRGGGA